MLIIKTNFILLIVILSFINKPLASELMSFDTNINAPLKVDAKKMYIDKISLEGGLSGSVNINQGPLNLKADQMKFLFTNDAAMPLITNLYAYNGVTISNQDMTATGNNASYSVNKNEIILLGNVTVKNNLTTLKGNKLSIDLELSLIHI